MFEIFEGNIEARIESAKAEAQRILNRQYNDMDEARFGLHVFLARHYNIPIFSDYFDKLTLEQLIFEIEAINFYNKPQEQKTSDLLSENKEEAKSMFDDWVEQDSKPMSDDQFNEEAKRFMETGNFKENE